MSNEFTFDSNVKSGEINLLSYSKNRDKNLTFPFAREIDSNGILTNNILEHTLELDLNVWKPVGMDDETFLKEMTYDVNLKIIDNSTTIDKREVNNQILQIFLWCSRLYPYPIPIIVSYSIQRSSVLSFLSSPVMIFKAKISGKFSPSYAILAKSYVRRLFSSLKTS